MGEEDFYTDYNFNSEKEFITSVLIRLSDHFKVEREVRGLNNFSGTELILDAIVCPRDTSKWKNPEVAFGIEFKLTTQLNSLKDYTRWAAQSIDYSYTNWSGYGYIPIFLCPLFQLRYIDPKGLYFLKHFLSQLGLGELKEHKKYGWGFYYHDSHLIWAENRGVVYGKSYDLKKRFGSR